MKLRNKKTGEIVYATMMASYVGGELQIRYYPVNNTESTHYKVYHSIFEFDEEWEDAPEEPKGIDEIDVVLDAIGEYCEEHSYYSGDLEKIKILNAVEDKLKAWKRLKDKGFRFDGWNWKTQCIDYNLDCTDITEEQIEEADEDLDSLFGGEE